MNMRDDLLCLPSWHLGKQWKLSWKSPGNLLSDFCGNPVMVNDAVVCYKVLALFIAVPTAKVTSLYRAEVRSTLARLAWQRPSCEGRNGRFVKYKYNVWQQGSAGVLYSGAVNVTEVRLVDLVPYTTYLAQVWYVNDIGEGPLCTALQFQTLQGSTYDTACSLLSSHVMYSRQNKWRHNFFCYVASLKCVRKK